MRITAAPPWLGKDDRARQVARAVGVQPARPRRARPPCAGRARARRAGRGRARPSARRPRGAPRAMPSSGGPKRPDHGARPGDADRPVAVLERRVGLGPRLRRTRAASAPPRWPGRRSSRGRGTPSGRPRPARPAAARRARARASAATAATSSPSCARSSVSARGGEAGLDDGRLVGELERDDLVGRVGDRRSGHRGERHRARAAERISACATSVVVPERESATTTS